LVAMRQVYSNPQGRFQSYRLAGVGVCLISLSTLSCSSNRGHVGPFEDCLQVREEPINPGGPADFPAVETTFKAAKKQGEFAYWSFTWTKINIGDCHQTEGTLILRSDGLASFTGSMWRDHSIFGKRWQSSFVGSDPSGNQVLRLGPLSGPVSHGAYVHIHSGLTFPTGQFPLLSRVTLTQHPVC
jgi:hypothetical protein